MVERMFGICFFDIKPPWRSALLRSCIASYDGGQRSRFTENSLVCFLLRLFSLSSRLNLYSRHILKIPSFPGPAPPQRHLERSAATTKTRFTGRKQNKRSEFCCLPVILRKGANGGKREGELSERESVVPVRIKIPVATADMRRHSDTLRAANAAMKEGANGGENTRTSFLRSEGVVVPVNNSSKEHRKQIMLAKP